MHKCPKHKSTTQHWGHHHSQHCRHPRWKHKCYGSVAPTLECVLVGGRIDMGMVMPCIFLRLKVLDWGGVSNKTILIAHTGHLPSGMGSIWAKSMPHLPLQSHLSVTPVLCLDRCEDSHSLLCVMQGCTGVARPLFKPLSMATFASSLMHPSFLQR